MIKTWRQLCLHPKTDFKALTILYEYEVSLVQKPEYKGIKMVPFLVMT